MSRKKKIIIYILAVLVSFISAVSMYFIIEVNKPPVEIPDTDAQFETTLKEAPKDGSLPTEHSATDVIAYTLYNVANTKEFKVITRGTSDAFIATIQIANERVVKNGSAMISTVSDGIVSFGTQRFYFPQEENKVLVRDAKKISNATATWNTNKDPECVTYKEMRKRYGWFPFQANGYIICDDTYLNKDDIVVKDNNDGTYKINFSLDPDSEKAPFWYRREIVTSSGSTIIPRFSKIEITFIIDKNYRLLEQHIKENYTVKTMGIEADTKTNVVDTFSYDNVEFDQESYNWFMQYRGLEVAGDSLDDGIKIKEDDIETMLVSSLQNDAKEDVNLDLSLNYKNINLNGKLALNINDLDNISFKLKLGNYITLELNNNIIYLNINDNKFKSSLSSLNLDLGSLDLNSILASLKEGTITRNDNNILIDTNLEILNIKLNLKFDIDKIEDKYNLNSITVKTNVLGDDLIINASKTNTGIDSIIDDNYKDLDLNPIISNIKNIINNKELNLYLEFSINNINVIASGDISFKDDLYANLNINFKMDKLEIPLTLVYFNDIAYIKYENIKLSINKEVLNSLSEFDYYHNIERIDF